MLRHFLYLDVDLTSEFLAQAEGGIYDEESIHARSQRGRRGGGKLGVGPIGGELGGSTNAEDEAARTVRQTPESRLDRLVTTLTEADDLLFLESDRRVPDVKRGAIVEADVALSMPNFVRMIFAAHAVGPMLQFLENTGVTPQLDEEATAGILGAIALGQMIPTVPVVGTLVAGAFKLVMQLKPEFVRLPPADLDGEATALVKIRRHLADGEHHNVVQFLMGQSSFPPEMRAAFDKAFEDEEQAKDMFVEAPAALVTPVAIYR